MNRISACLITLNEEHNLPRALASLAGIADEIVVVDSGSTDRTEEIAQEYGAKIFFREWSSYGEQKNFAAECASNEWILSMDADEELSSALQTSLLQWKNTRPKFSVYEVARKTWYLGAWINHSGWYPDFQRRLYDRDEARFSGIIHESVRFVGPPGRLNGDLLHYTVRSFEEHQQKVDRYTQLSAQQLHWEGKRYWRTGMLLGAPWRWIHTFVLRGGFLDGHRGVLIAWMAARSVRLKYSKLGKLIKEKKRERGGAPNS
ncbi:MAG: glycosyltransferase family 2 protein [Candidatus Acidiferrum sp.]